jgi:PKD repeat protein
MGGTGIGVDEGRSITTDSIGNVYSIGNYTCINGDFNPGTGYSPLTPVGSNDIYIQKLDVNGDFIWVETIGGSSYDSGFDIEIDKSGNIYVLGAFQGTSDLRPGTGTYNRTSNGSFDIFVLKMDNNRNFKWIEKFGSQGTDLAGGLAIDNSGNVYVTGSFQYTVNFLEDAPGVMDRTSNGLWDVFVAKIDSVGSMISASTYGSTDEDRGESISVDNSGNIYVTGYYNGTVNFLNTSGFDITSNGGDDVFILKIPQTGDPQVASIGGVNDDQGISIITDNLGNAAAIGTFNGTVDFDFGVGNIYLTSGATNSLFAIKLRDECIASFSNTDNGDGNFSFADLSNTFDGSITNWNWDFGDGSSSTNQNPTHSFPSNDTFTVTLTTTTSNGCTSNYTQVIDVLGAPCGVYAGFTHTDNGNNQISFTDTSSHFGTAPYTYLWDFETSGSTGWMNPSTTFPYNGTWAVKLTITDAVGCIDSVTQHITVSGMPCNASITSSDNGNGIYSFTSIVTGTGSGPYQYYWIFEDGGEAFTQNTNHTYTANGTYEIALFTEDLSNNCQSLAFDTVTVTNIGCPSTTPNFNYIDNGNGNYTFTNTSSGNYFISNWNFGDGNTSSQISPNHTFSSNGVYTVVLAISDSNIVATGTCIDYHTISINVTNVPVPLPCNSGFSIYSDSINNNFIVVNSSSGSNLTFFWEFGDGNTSTLAYPNYAYTTPGPFNLCLTVDDGNGCVSTYCDTIGSNGVVFKLSNLSINVVAPPILTAIDNQENLKSEVNIYPNPASNTITITNSKIKLSQINIIDVTGKSIKTITKNKNAIDISDLSNGIYFIQIISDKEIITKKFIKN